MSKKSDSQHPWTPGAARRSAVGRLRWRINAFIFLFSVVVTAVVILYFAFRSDMRLGIDATKTRAYSLSDQSKELLRSLDGEWLVAVLLVEQNVGSAEKRQLDEVLRRYTEASPNITVSRIDPTNPATLDQYESLLGRLRLIYAREIEMYDSALDDGSQSFEELTIFAQQQSRLLGAVLQRLAAAQIDVRDFQQRVGMFTLLAEQGDQVLAEVRKSRAVNDAQPIADYEVARSILAEALSQWAHQISELAAQYQSWSQQNGLDDELRNYLKQSSQEYAAVAQRMAESADPLRHLPPIELAVIGQQLKTGEAVIIVGPKSAAVIPSQQFLPRVTEPTANRLTFDRRFRGEQLLSATIRSLLVDHMPMVVFVHNEPQSLMRRDPKNTDLLGVATLLSLSRFEIREWIVADGEPPQPAPRQKVVWVVVPTSARQGLQTSRREQQLIDAATDLVMNGQSVLLNVYPSLLPGFNQPDPWAKLAERMHVKANTGGIVVDEILQSEGPRQINRTQVVQNYYNDNDISRAVHGEQTMFPLAVPLEPMSTEGTKVTISVVAEIDPATNRWIESDWSVDESRIDEPTREQRYFHPVPVVVAVAKPGQREFGQQRFIVAGSTSWLMTAITDAMIPIGGDRAILANPGNQELLLASVAWLADMPELISPSAVSQQVARLDGISRGVWLRWFLYMSVGVPLGCLACAMGMWFIRRR